MSERDGALLNGALMAVGALAVLDNVVAHWLLGLHRVIPDPELAPVVEVGLVLGGAGLFLLGLARERRARRRPYR